MSCQAGRGGFAVGAGQRNYGDAIGLPRWEQHIQNGFGHIAGDAFAGANMHPQAGGGVNFYHNAVGFPQGPGDVRW